MRLSVDHRTTYRFSTPLARLVQLLRVTPSNSHDQTVAVWRIEVDCDALLRERRDGFGNIVTMLYAEGPLDGITIAVAGEVLTTHSDGVVHASPEPLPPPVFLRPTAATPHDSAIAAFAQSMEAGLDRLAGLHAINAALHGRFEIDWRRGPPLDASRAWEAERATPRDLAQIFAVAARAIGAPARFVSGYHLADREGVHLPAPHGWAEAHVDGLGWVGFDPCTGCCPEDSYVRVAVSLDAVGAAPVAGSRLGEGVERLDVDISVQREG